MDPAEKKSEEVVDEVERGRSERTPWLVLGGVQIVVGLLVAAVLSIAFLAYLLA